MTKFLKGRMKLMKVEQAIQAIAVFIIAIFSILLKNTNNTISVFLCQK